MSFPLRVDAQRVSIGEKVRVSIGEKVGKGAWRMPWLTEAMKDVISCDKPRVGANIL